MPLWEAAFFKLHAGHDLPHLGSRIVGMRLIGLVGEQKLGDHFTCGLGAVGLGFDLHPRRRRAQATRGQHALALDLDHADPAIAIGAITGFRRVA